MISRLYEVVDKFNPISADAHKRRKFSKKQYIDIMKALKNSEKP